MQPIITFDKKMTRGLRKAIVEARTQGKDIFQFQGREYVTGYAEYLLEYLEQKFKEKEKG